MGTPSLTRASSWDNWRTLHGEARDAALRAVRGGSLTFAAVERFLREEVKRYGEQSLRGPHPG